MSYPITQRGDRGPKVYILQSLLHLYGHLGLGDVDGQHGPGTQRAIRAFQARYGLDVDGVAGRRTWERLLEGPIEAPAAPPETVYTAKPIVTAHYSSEVEAEQQRLWDTAIITDPNRFAWAADKAFANRDRYQEVCERVNFAIPWWFVAVIHGLEASYSFSKHLHNGDPLSGRTYRVPKGRPKSGAPPFTWDESAYDALTMPGKRYDRVGDWSIPAILWRLEGFNGYGYRLYRGIFSPYVWAGTNHYTRGKYTSDGHYSSTAVSEQAGAGGLAKILMTG